jgi:diadenosine tetraphosphate (Ap4A) HIT family hydrolase
MCANQGLEDSGWGVRFLQGGQADVFLQRSGRVRGYAVAIWKHGHVVEPTQLPAEQAAGFWLETLRGGAAIEAYLRPVKLNYLTLGNSLPHLHTHIVPRYADDPFPGGPVPFDALDDGRQPERRLQADALALRAMVGTR